MSEVIRKFLIENKLKLPHHKASDFSEGERVLIKHDASDYLGEKFSMGECGVVTKVTRCTVHVKDPRGHIHRGRQADLFVKWEDLEPFGL